MLNSDFLTNTIIVGTIVGDIQSTITIHEGQVTVTIKTTHMVGAQSDEVTVVDIMDRGSSITEDRGGIGKYLIRTCRGVTTGKDSIMNGDTTGIQITPLT